jgi:epoxyqueuosine reductase QueG
MVQDVVDTEKLDNLAKNIKAWGKALGFQQVAIVEPNLDQASTRLKKWLADGFQALCSGWASMATNATTLVSW